MTSSTALNDYEKLVAIHGMLPRLRQELPAELFAELTANLYALPQLPATAADIARGQEIAALLTPAPEPATPLPPGPSETLFLAANVLNHPEERHPSWVHIAAADGALVPLVAWLRAEAVFAAARETALPEALAFARAVLSWE